MAWTRINAICGHSHQVQLYGPNAGRESKAAWLEGRECPECYSARTAAERAAATEAAKAANADLPALIGSPKQIAWAETIRAEKVAQLRFLAERLAAAPADAPGMDVARKIIAERLGRTEAKWWIDFARQATYDAAWLKAKIAKATAPIL